MDSQTTPAHADWRDFLPLVDQCSVGPHRYRAVATAVQISEEAEAPELVAIAYGRLSRLVDHLDLLGCIAAPGPGEERVAALADFVHAQLEEACNLLRVADQYLARGPAQDRDLPGSLPGAPVPPNSDAAGPVRSALTEVDRLTQAATTTIKGLAGAAVACILHDGSSAALKHAATLLDQVEVHAETLCNDVNYTAEQQGCDFSAAKAPAAAGKRAVRR